MSRVDKHDLPKRRVAARLRRLGLSVRMAPASESYDLLVNGKVRVTLRVAFPSQRRHTVTVSGTKYRYRYKTWHFNFHHHGRFDRQYTDFFVCLAIARGRIEDAYVIPWEAVTGKTFSLHGGQRRYSGQYRPYRDRWERVADQASALRNVA